MQLQKIKELLAQNSVVYLIASGNKDKLNEYGRLIGNATVLSIKDMAELLEVDARLLDSTESEQNYEEIAKGKVKQIQGALQAGGLTASELTNLYILGDDYGASFESITFCYDSTLNADELFNVVYDEQDHIKIIRTNRQELDGGCAPGYFSHRIIDSLRTHYGLADKKAAFEKLSAEIVRAADINKQFGSFATVAIAWGIGLSSPNCKSHTVYYPLISDISELAKEGFDFDRVQRIRGDGPTIAEISPLEKDREFVRGQLVTDILKNELFRAPQQTLLSENKQQFFSSSHIIEASEQSKELSIGAAHSPCFRKVVASELN